MRTTWPVLVACCVPLACTPTRDNPNDPRNAPEAELRIVGVPHVDGVCPTTVVQWPEVFSVSRGTCLALDATSTTDDTPLPELTFDYELLDACGDTVGPLQGSDETLVLDRALLQRCPLDQAIEFAVTVQDPAGGRSRATAKIELQNGPPTAEAGPSRSFPIGGFPWSPGEPFDIQFSGRGSTDPDADALTYCFRFNGEPEVCSTDPESPLFRQQAGPERDHVTAVLRVHDADPNDPALAAVRLASPPDRTVAYVREPNLWLGGDNFHERVDGVSTEVVTPFSAPRAIELIPSETAPSLLLAYGSDLGTAPWPAGAPITTMLSGSASNLHGVAVDPAANVFWTIQREVVSGAGSGCQPSAGDDVTIRSYDLTTFVQQTCDHHAVQPNFYPPDLVAAGGAMWAPKLLGTALVAVSASAAPVTVTDARRVVSGLSIRPGTDEAWALWSPDFYIGTGNVDAGSRLVSYAATAPSTAQTILELGSDYSFTFGWVDEDRAWITFGSEGLVLLDVSVLEANGSREDAIVLRVPDVIPFVFVAIDPESGTLWALDATGNALGVTLDGLVRSHDIPNFFPILADPGGYLWFNESFATRRGLVPGPASVAVTNMLTIPPGAFDELTGGVWVAVSLPTAVVRLAEDGTRQRTISNLILDGSPAFVPLLSGLRAIPGTETLFGFSVSVFGGQSDGVVRIEAGGAANPTDPAPAELILENEVEGILALGANLHPTVPDATGASVFWTVFDDAGVPTVATLSTSGTLVRKDFTAMPGAAWDPGVDKLVGALSPSDNRYCFAFEDVATTSVLLQSIPLTGSVPAPVAIPIPANTTLVSVASSPGMCWLGFGPIPSFNSASIVGVTNAGAVTRTHSETEVLLSIQPLSANEVWFAFRGVDEKSYKVRLSDYAGGAFQTREAFVVPETTPTVFFAGTGTRSIRIE